jgi:hypothetical protein
MKRKPTKKKQTRKTKTAPVLEMNVGKCDGTGGMPRGLRIAWAQFTKAEVPLGGIRILCHRYAGSRMSKAAILDALADAQHMFENYFQPLFKHPDELSEAVIRARLEALESEKATVVDEANPQTWPAPRHDEAVDLAEKIGFIFFMKQATPEHRRQLINFWLKNRPDKIPDVVAVCDEFAAETKSKASPAA